VAAVSTNIQLWKSVQLRFECEQQAVRYLNRRRWTDCCKVSISWRVCEIQWRATFVRAWRFNWPCRRVICSACVTSPAHCCHHYVILRPGISAVLM